MAGSIAPINIDITARTAGLTKGVNDAKSQVKDLDRSMQRIGQGTGTPASLGGLKAIRRDAQATTRAVNNAKAATSSLLNTAVKGLVAGATLGVGVLVTDLVGNLTGGLSTAVKESVMLAAEVEKSALAFEVMLGSADAAGRMLGNLRSYAAESPFNSTDVQDSAKQLTAFGIEAEQVLPTIRALGDVASGLDKPLGQLVNAYGQVATAGRLMGTELLQFTQAGVPIIDALSKVLQKPKEDIKSLVEQGRVGFPHVVRAFKAMTEEGGKFAGMGDRYGKSMAGLFEQLQDAGELAKAEFGRVIIEETGLKDATRDLTAFTTRVKDMANELRPAVRFTGDLVKAAAQVGYELSKAGAQLGGIYVDGWLHAVPELREMATVVERIVKGAKDFTIDPVDVAELGIVLTESATEWVRLIHDGIVQIGDRWNDKLIKPMVDAAVSVKGVADSILETIRQAQALKEGSKTAAAIAAANVVPFVSGAFALNAALSGPNPPAGAPGHDPIRAIREEQIQRYAREIKTAGDLDRAILSRNRDEMMRLWAEQDAKAGRPVMFPPRAAGSAGLQGQVIDPRSAPDGLAGVMAKFFKDGEDWRTRIRSRALEMREIQTRRRDGTEAAAGVVGGAFNVLSDSARKAASALDKMKVPNAVAPEVMDAAKRANEFGPITNPVARLHKDLDDLYQARGRGLIPDPVVFTRATANILRKASADLDWQFRLPSAAELGSTDFARAQALAVGGNQQQDVRGILQAMLTAYEQSLVNDADIVRELQLIREGNATPARLER